MSKSRRSKTLAAGDMIGLTPRAKLFNQGSKVPEARPNRQIRRAQRKNER